MLALDLDRLDRDAVMPVEPIDLLFARAHAAHVDLLYVAGRAVIADGRLAGVDLEAVEAALRAQYRERLPARADFLEAWAPIPEAVAGCYGCC